MHFGFGKTTCPDCFSNKTPLLLLDKTYWLNRFIIRTTRQNRNHIKSMPSNNNNSNI